MRATLKKISLVSALLLAFALTLTPVSVFAAPQAQVCSAGWRFDALINLGTTFVAYSPILSQTNTKSTTITATFQHTISVSQTFTSGNTTGVTLNFEFVQVKDDVNSGVQYTIQGTFTQGVTVTLQPGQTVNAQYGVVRQKASGHLYYLQSNCGIAHDQGRVNVSSPWKLTWKLT